MFFTTATVIIVPFLIMSAALLLALWTLIFAARVRHWGRMIQNRAKGDGFDSELEITINGLTPLVHNNFPESARRLLMNR